jgi:WS/DGAT/MGAT family acyltransferase
MERLTAEDQLMLWPDQIWPQDVGALAILDGARLLEADGRFRIEQVRQAISARLHLIPRFRQVLCTPRRGLGPPLWIDVRALDVADHVRVATLPAPGDEAALLLVAEQLRRRRLDRSRPLWEMWFLPGLPDHRVGLFVRMHHAVADGIAAVATIGTLLDTDPHSTSGCARPWTPSPRPTTRELFADNLRRRAGALSHAFSVLARPVTTGRRIRAAWPAMRQAFAEVPTPVTSLDRTVGPDRTMALIRSRLDTVKRIAKAHDATVNDVLLTITAAGLCGLLHGRGERVGVLPVYVPVTLRQPRQRAHARGNMIGQMIIPLPVGTSDPSQRLRQIAAETRTRKARPHPPLGTVLRNRVVRRALLRVLDRHPVSVTTANVPGPPLPVYLAGMRVLEVFPVLPLIGKVPLGVGAISYSGQFTIGVIADADVGPDLEVFVARAASELEVLAELTRRASSPGARVRDHPRHVDHASAARQPR